MFGTSSHAFFFMNSSLLQMMLDVFFKITFMSAIMKGFGELQKDFKKGRTYRVDVSDAALYSDTQVMDFIVSRKKITL